MKSVKYEIVGRRSGWVRGPYRRDQVVSAAHNLSVAKGELVDIIEVTVTTERRTIDTVSGPEPTTPGG